MLGLACLAYYNVCPCWNFVSSSLFLRSKLFHCLYLIPLVICDGHFDPFTPVVVGSE